MVEQHSAGLAAKGTDRDCEPQDVVPSGSLCADDWETPVIDGLSIGQVPSHVAVSGEARSPRGRICISQDLDHGLHPDQVALPARVMNAADRQDGRMWVIAASVLLA